ncbi:DUF4214 domain-containing protein, partial [Pseudomonas luteola]|uniref:DUF4214 domain-containing protein n=1 Tax=Pseudomonas luteola TaxID=47886 RepID=UPI00289D7EA1
RSVRAVILPAWTFRTERSLNANGTVAAPFGSSPQVFAADVAGDAGDDVTFATPASLNTVNTWILNSDANLSVTFGATESTAPAAPAAADADAVTAAAAAVSFERIVVTGNGDDTVTVSDNVSTYLDGGDGNNTLTTSAGNDTVVVNDGDNVISTGAGNDTIILGTGNNTVDGGSGFDVVRVTGTLEDNRVFVEHNHTLVLQNGTIGNEVSALNIQLVETENGNIAIASSQTEATALRFYEAVLGRTADAEGAQYWTEQLASNGGQLSNIAQGFVNSTEFQSIGIDSSADYINALYQGALGRSAEAAGLEYWTQQLNEGVSQADVAVGIVGSYEAEGYAGSHVVIVQGQV